MSRPRALDNLVEELCRLPGIGEKTAQRLAFFILRTPKVRAERDRGNEFGESDSRRSGSVHDPSLEQRIRQAS